MNFLLADGSVLTTVSALFTWQNIAILLSGALGMKLLGFISDWLSGKGLVFVKAELEKFRAELNQSKLLGGLLGQINADDAVINILEATIPDVVTTLSADVQEMLKNNTLTDAAKWRAMAQALWAKAEGQITGGAHDYLEHSSFQDGVTIAETILRRFFNQQQLTTTLAAPVATAPVETVTTTTTTTAASAAPTVPNV